MNISTLSLLLAAVFKNVLKDKTVSCFINMLNELKSRNLEKIFTCYSDFICSLQLNDKNRNFYNHIKNLIYKDENMISSSCAGGVSPCILKDAAYELSLFDNLLKQDYISIKSFLKSEYPESIGIIEHLPEFTIEGREDFKLEDIIKSYQTCGYGIFARHKAFYFSGKSEIIPVKNFDNFGFDRLKNYEYQKNILYSNTKAFIENKEANNILLYGDRGCGKSSSVKALINEFDSFNLKIIQISKNSFADLNDLYEKIRPLPLKFIIFADDISFDGSEESYSAAKSALEGSLEAMPENALIYAAANRVHLVKESFSAREGDEVHYNDTIDEAVSLSDRFGITLVFSLLSKNEYLDIVQKIAADYGVKSDEIMLRKAEEFAALKGIRTPRTALQFIKSHIAGLKI